MCIKKVSVIGSEVEGGHFGVFVSLCGGTTWSD